MEPDKDAGHTFALFRSSILLGRNGKRGDEHNIWGVQHLLHPDMTVRATFAELYFSDAILDVVKELVGPER